MKGLLPVGSGIAGYKAYFKRIKDAFGVLGRDSYIADLLYQYVLEVEETDSWVTVQVIIAKLTNVFVLELRDSVLSQLKYAQKVLPADLVPFACEAIKTLQAMSCIGLTKDQMDMLLETSENIREAHKKYDASGYAEMYDKIMRLNTNLVGLAKKFPKDDSWHDYISGFVEPAIKVLHDKKSLSAMLPVAQALLSNDAGELVSLSELIKEMETELAEKLAKAKQASAKAQVLKKLAPVTPKHPHRKGGGHAEGSKRNNRPGLQT